MTKTPTVFEQTARLYLDQIRQLDVAPLEEALGVKGEGEEILVPLFGKTHRITPTGVLDPWGKPAGFDRCVILCKYLLLCPKTEAKNSEWVTYRCLKNSGPLTKHFDHDVEEAIASFFAGRSEALGKSILRLGGVPPSLALSYDHGAEWAALPKVPLMLLFNDVDEMFPAKCNVLFRDSAESYLDAECLAMVGRLLFTLLSEDAFQQ